MIVSSRQTRHRSGSRQGNHQTFILCRTRGRTEKEKAIRNRFSARMEDDLARLAKRSTRFDRMSIDDPRLAGTGSRLRHS
jgi:hypothetical protein